MSPSRYRRCVPTTRASTVTGDAGSEGRDRQHGGQQDERTQQHGNAPTEKAEGYTGATSPEARRQHSVPGRTAARAAAAPH
ncbi:hypothetical protein G6F23_015412 [Rhizopus arrhizus]|nr:hypothetical protein G6F23_015412 [Rhizopus arrhizus]